MAGFRKAKAEQAALKMGIYGPAGKGKTFTTLLIAEGLAKLSGKRVAYVDTERGTDFYCKEVPNRKLHPQAFDFDALYTRSLSDVVRDVKALKPSEYAVVVIDSMTHIWEAAIGAYGGGQTSIGTIPMHAWGKIKKPYKELINHLLSSPMHVIFCGRQGNEFGEDEKGDIKKIGVKMKAEGETPYEPHILLRLESDKLDDGGEGIIAIAEKDRTGILAGRAIRLWPAPAGKEEAHTFDSLVRPILPLLGGTQAKLESDDETAAKDAEALAEEERKREAASAKLLKRFAALIQLAESEEALKEVGKQITPEVKKQMTTTHVTELRGLYQGAEQQFASERARREAEESQSPPTEAPATEPDVGPVNDDDVQPPAAMSPGDVIDAKVDELLTIDRWPDFLAGWHKLVEDQVTLADFGTGAGKFVVRMGRKGKEDQISRQLREEMVRASLMGRFDWKTWKVMAAEK